MALGIELEDVIASTSLDLAGVNTDDDLRIDENWIPLAYDPDGGLITETIPMVAIGATADIRAALETLDGILEKAYKWKNDKSRANLIRFNYYEGTGTRVVWRTVTGGRIEPAQITGSNNFLELGTARNIYRFNLKLEMVPGWEQTEASSSSGALDRFGGSVAITNSAGSRPARLGRVIASPAATTLGNCWLGIRDPRYGVTDFIPRQDFEDGGRFNGTTLETGGASEYGNYVQTSFATEADLALRVQWVMADWGGTTITHMNGKYLVLAKANLTATGKAGLQLRWGFGPGSYTFNPEVEVTYNSSNWNAYPLGYVQLPPWPTAQNVNAEMNNFIMEFWAEKLIAGSFDLKMDAFVFMPTDHLFTMKVASSVPAPPSGLDIMTREDWHHFVYGTGVTGNRAVTGMSQNFQDWTLPLGTSKMVLVSEILSSNVHYLPNPGGTLTFSIYRNPITGFPFKDS